MSKYAQYIILCEDINQQSFVRTYLKSCGIPAPKIRFLPVSAGNGSGEQYVREKFPNEVKALRQKNSYSDLGVKLIVVIDCDKENIQSHKNELDDQLIEKRKRGESIAIFTPRRNIETWIYWLSGNQVNETDDYKNKYSKNNYSEECTKCVKYLVSDVCTKDMPEDAPESLKDACLEWQRVRP